MPPTSTSALGELARDETSRKRFLRMMGGGGAAAGLAVLLSACGDDQPTRTSTQGGGASPAAGGSTATGPKSGGDIDILNYALMLEFIEATFYEEVEASGMIKDKQALDLVKKFGQTEQEHAETIAELVKELGGRPVKAPRTAFGPVIEGGEEMILIIAATVENLGAAAYLGQAGNIESKEVLASALSIHTVEARHAAALNRLVGRPFQGGSGLEGSVPDGAFAVPMTKEQVLEQAQPFLAT